MKLPIDGLWPLSIRFVEMKFRKEANVKRFALLLSLCALYLGACSPAITVENQVLPTLYSVTVPDTRAETVVIQGRYFGDGFEGQASGSYVLLGADVQGDGGVRVRPTDWTPGRIEVGIPEGAGSGFVFVFVDGVRSNGLPASLP